MNAQNNLPTVVNLALENAFDRLLELGSDDLLFTQIMSTAFGEGADASAFKQAWTKGDFSSFPKIEIRNASEINGANGAFAITTGKIYLAQEFIDVNDISAIAAVLLEEYGHYIDSQVNVTDSAGDEGDIFARLVQGNSISQSELAVLKTEDDTATVTLDGQVVEIEQAINTITFNGNTNQFNTPGFNIDRTQKTFFLIHGFKNGLGSFGDLANKLQDNNPGANIVQVDWTSVNGRIDTDYLTVQGRLYDVGTALSVVFSTLNIDPSKTEIIGYSLGAHVAGFAGRGYANIRQIVGLDPAGFLYETVGPGGRLDPDDAQRVVVIHSSNSLTGTGTNSPDRWGLGFYDNLGDLDIYIKKDNRLYGANIGEPNHHGLAIDVYKDLVSGEVYGGKNEWGKDLNFNDSFDLNKFNNFGLTGDYTVNLNTKFVSANTEPNFVNNGTNNNDIYLIDADSQLGTQRINEATIALRTAHNTYIRTDAGSAFFQNNGAGSWEEFQIITQNDGKIALQTIKNSYMRANRDIAWNVDQSGGIGDWEKFSVIDLSNGNIALKSSLSRPWWAVWAESLYIRGVYSPNAYSSTVNLSDTLNSWETFTPEFRNNDIDTLDFSHTDSRTIRLDLGYVGQQQINDNLSLTVSTNFGSNVYLDIENATGGSLNDTIYGNDLNSLLIGGEGNDSLYGRGGNDTLSGNEGDDTLYGGYGNDLLDGDSGPAVSGSAKDVLYGNHGNDTIFGGEDTDTLYGNEDNDLMYGEDNNDSLDGNEGNDTLFGDSGDDTLTGGIGADSLYGGVGNDSLNGGQDNDIYGNSGSGVVTLYRDANYGGVSQGIGIGLYSTADLLIGNDQLSSLTITPGILVTLYQDDYFGGNSRQLTESSAWLGSLGFNDITSWIRVEYAANFNIYLYDDLLSGGLGDDTLNGGAGNDTLDGGEGTDTADYSDALGAVFLSLEWINNQPPKVVNDGFGTSDTLLGIDRIIGSNYDDRIDGNSQGNDQLLGGAGNDSLRGWGGNDFLDGGDGNDTLEGAEGDDTLLGGVGNDILTGGSGSDTTTYANGQSSILLTDNGSGNFTAQFAIGGVNYTHQLQSIETIIESQGNDTITVVIPSTGVSFDGGLGQDTLDYSLLAPGSVQVTTTAPGSGTVTIGTITQSYQSIETLILPTSPDIVGTAGNDTLTGTASGEKIFGLGGNDRLSGLGGNDTLDGGAGIDTMSGGTGDDLYIVDVATDSTLEDASAGTDTVQSSVTRTLGVNLENLVLTGTGALAGTGNTLNNIITGNGGNNNLSGLDGNDSLVGGAGNDTLDGGTGIDTLIGGVGNDVYRVDSNTDNITENTGEGKDRLDSSVDFSLDAPSYAQIENLTLTGTAVNGTGNALNNTIIGNGSNNSLNGGAGNDILNGGAGTDTLIGGAGNDSYQVDTITDTITENAGEGTDTIQSSLDFNLNGYAQIENLTLTGTAIINGTGNALNNTINGNGSNNSLNGGAGNDNLNGGAGDDTLIGGLGNDNLTGSTGADRFVFNTPSEARDTLRDFSAAAGDLIQILAAGFGGGLVTGTLTGDRLLSGAGISAAGNALQRFIFNTTNGALFFDADGNGAGFAATQIATLTGVTALGNTNIVVI